MSHISAHVTQEDINACFPECYEFTRLYEGGYVDHPKDPGGCTNKGVTRATLEAWRKKPTTCADVKALSDEEAGDIYASKYWRPMWGHKLPVGLNLCVWDWGVNSGPSRSVKHLQKMVGSAADGKIGPNTLRSVELFVEAHGINKAIEEFTQRRQKYYESLGTFGTFGKGWTRRNNACRDKALELAKKAKAPEPTKEEQLEKKNVIETATGLFKKWW